MTEKEKILIAGCLTGEKTSWDTFVLQYSSLVFHTIRKTIRVYRMEPDGDHVDDLFQEFFHAVLRDDFKKLRQFRGDGGCSLASWIRLVTVRLTIDFLRRRSPASGDAFNECYRDSDPLDSLIIREEATFLTHAIEELPAKDRLFVDLCFRQGLQPQDIAAILRMSVNGVYTYKSRILSKLRNTLTRSCSL